MYASIPDALRALAKKIGADANGRNEEEILNNIVVKLGGTPVTNHGVAGSIGAMTKVVDLDVMHNMTTLNVTPTSEAQTITPESPVDGYSQVNVAAVPVPETFEVGFAINFPGSGDPRVTSTTKTYAELMAALNNGKNLVPVFDITLPEGAVISSVTSGTGFIDDNDSVIVACKIAAEAGGTPLADIYAIVTWNNPEVFTTNEFFVMQYNAP